MLFVGTYEYTIDAKQRLAIPSEVRDRLDHKADGKDLYAVLLGGSLGLYTERGFEKRAEELDHSQRPPEEVLLFEQEFFGNAARLELDSQGRVRLPERLMKLAGLERDVVLVGVKDHLQIHDRQSWQRHMEATLAKRKELLSNPRRLMRPDQKDQPPQAPPQNQG